MIMHSEGCSNTLVRRRKSLQHHGAMTCQAHMTRRHCKLQAGSTSEGSGKQRHQEAHIVEEAEEAGYAGGG